jgi:GT2 family glycosyltransferase
MKSKAVSIITIHRNNLRYLTKYLCAVQENTHHKNYEIILIDNKSDDLCLEEIAKLTDPETLPGLNIQVKFNREMKSFAENCNIGSEISAGDILCFLNDDTEVQPNWLTEMLKTLNRSKVGIVGARMYFPTLFIQHAGIAFHQNKMPGHIWWNRLHKDDPRLLEEKEFKAITGGCMVIRKKLFESLGRFDENYKYAGYEDIDLCLRANKAGYKIKYCPKAEVIHHEKITQNKFDNNTRDWYFQHNTDYFMKKWGDKIEPDYHLYEPGVI